MCLLPLGARRHGDKKSGKGLDKGVIVSLPGQISSTAGAAALPNGFKQSATKACLAWRYRRDNCSDARPCLDPHLRSVKSNHAAFRIRTDQARGLAAQAVTRDARLATVRSALKPQKNNAASSSVVPTKPLLNRA